MSDPFLTAFLFSLPISALAKLIFTAGCRQPVYIVGPSSKTYSVVNAERDIVLIDYSVGFRPTSETTEEDVEPSRKMAPDVHTDPERWETAVYRDTRRSSVIAEEPVEDFEHSLTLPINDFRSHDQPFTDVRVVEYYQNQLHNLGLKQLPLEEQLRREDKSGTLLSPNTVHERAINSVILRAVRQGAEQLFSTLETRFSQERMALTSKLQAFTTAQCSALPVVTDSQSLTSDLYKFLMEAERCHLDLFTVMHEHHSAKTLGDLALSSHKVATDYETAERKARAKEYDDKVLVARPSKKASKREVAADVLGTGSKGGTEQRISALVKLIESSQEGLFPDSLIESIECLTQRARAREEGIAPIQTAGVSETSSDAEVGTSRSMVPEEHQHDSQVAGGGILDSIPLAAETGVGLATECLSDEFNGSVNPVGEPLQDDIYVSSSRQTGLLVEPRPSIHLDRRLVDTHTHGDPESQVDDDPSNPKNDSAGILPNDATLREEEAGTKSYIARKSFISLYSIVSDIAYTYQIPVLACPRLHSISHLPDTRSVRKPPSPTVG